MYMHIDVINFVLWRELPPREKQFCSTRAAEQQTQNVILISKEAARKQRRRSQGSAKNAEKGLMHMFAGSLFDLIYNVNLRVILWFPASR